jgi:putative hemolysin
MLQTLMFEIGLIVLLVIANGIFSMSEIAVVSSRKARLDRMAQTSRRSALALRLAENPDRFLSTIQIGITAIGIFAGAYGGATIARQLEVYINEFPRLAPYSGAIGVAVVVAGITYLSLVLGELVPKRIALNSPERIATIVAAPMHFLSRLGAPAVSLLSVSTRAVLTLLRAKPSVEPSVTEEELRLMLRQAAQSGTIPAREREIVERVFRLGDRRVNAMMTPRVDIEWLDIGKPVEELREIARSSSHSRLPVCEGEVEKVVGILAVRDLWADPRASQDVRQILQPPLFVPENTPAFDLLEQFRRSRNHAAVAVNEFGGVVGFVTPTDILEALVGDLPDPQDSYVPCFVQRDDGSWSIDAAADVEEVRSILDIGVLKGQKQHAYQTIAGYVIDRLGHIPQIGESIEAGGYRFEIIDMDGMRVDRLVATPLPRPQSSP